MYYQKKQNHKYKNVPTEYGGNKYQSKKESIKAWELDQLMKAKKITSWSKQKKIELYGENGDHVANYYVDFEVTHNDGTVELIEIKSPITATPLWKLKWELTQDKYKNEISRGEMKLTVEY